MRRVMMAGILLVVIIGCATAPPVQSDAAEPSEAVIRGMQACLILMGYEDVRLSGVLSSPTLRAWDAYMHETWGRDYAHVSNKIRSDVFNADCEEAFQRAKAEHQAPEPRQIPLYRR